MKNATPTLGYWDKVKICALTNLRLKHLCKPVLVDADDIHDIVESFLIVIFALCIPIVWAVWVLLQISKVFTHPLRKDVSDARWLAAKNIIDQIKSEYETKEDHQQADQG